MVEVIACRTNDHKEVFKLLRLNIFSFFGVLRFLISDKGNIFLIRPLYQDMDLDNL